MFVRFYRLFSLNPGHVQLVTTWETGMRASVLRNPWEPITGEVGDTPARRRYSLERLSVEAALGCHLARLFHQGERDVPTPASSTKKIIRKKKSKRNKRSLQGSTQFFFAWAGSKAFQQTKRRASKADRFWRDPPSPHHHHPKHRLCWINGPQFGCCLSGKLWLSEPSVPNVPSFSPRTCNIDWLWHQ